jgi:hypothetical protein
MTRMQLVIETKDGEVLGKSFECNTDNLSVKALIESLIPTIQEAVNTLNEHMSLVKTLDDFLNERGFKPEQ